MACLQHYRAQLGVEGVFAWGIALQTSPSTTTEVDLCVNRLHALGTYIPTSSRDGQVCIGVQSCPRTHNNSELLHLCSKVSAPAFQRDCPSMQVCVVSDSCSRGRASRQRRPRDWLHRVTHSAAADLLHRCVPSAVTLHRVLNYRQWFPYR